MTPRGNMTPRGKAAIAFIRLPTINDSASLHDALVDILALFSPSMQAHSLKAIRHAAEEAWAIADAALADLYKARQLDGYDDPVNAAEGFAVRALNGHAQGYIHTVGAIIAGSFSSRSGARKAFDSVAETL